MAQNDEGRENEYSSYDDYLRQTESVAESLVPDDAYDDVTPDQDPSITEPTVHYDDGSGSSGSMDTRTLSSNGNVTPAHNASKLLSDGSTVSETAEAAGSAVSATEQAGGVLSAVKNGVGSAIGGTFGALTSSLKGLFGKGAAKAGSIASSLNVPVQAVAVVMGLAGVGGVGALLALLVGNQQVKFSDEANCNNLEMIDEYVAENGAGDDWTEKSAQGAAKAIHSALSSVTPWEFETWEWSGGEEGWGTSGTWTKTTRTNEGFGFSDEVIAGMLSNAYAESKIRADCYEMDYLVHDIQAKDDNDQYKYGTAKTYGTILEYGAAKDSDFELGRYHHSNWDNYCARMFELYDGAGMSINEDAYKWKSDYSGPGAVHSSGAIRGLTGYYPGIGLWQWTGQRAYNLSRFADIQKDPDDGNQDGNHDTMYTIDCQLAFLYYENWPGFKTFKDRGTPYMELTYGGHEEYSRQYKVDGETLENIKKGQEEGMEYYDNISILEDNGENGGKVEILFEQAEGRGYNTVAWGRQNSFTFHGEIGDDNDYAYRTLSYPGFADPEGEGVSAQDEFWQPMDEEEADYVGEDASRKGPSIEGNDFIHEKDEEYGGHDGITIDQDAYQNWYDEHEVGLYRGQKKAKLDPEKDIRTAETQLCHPKFVIYSDGPDKYIGHGDWGENEYAPDYYLAPWDEFTGGTCLDKNITSQDNRTYAVFECDYDGDMGGNNYELIIDDNLEIDDPVYGNKNVGWISKEVYSDLEGHTLCYDNNNQSRQMAHVDDAETRRDTRVCFGGTFNDEQLEMYRNLYDIEVSWYKEEVPNDDGIGTHEQWFRKVALVLTDHDEDEGDHAVVSQLRRKMTDPEGKYLGADMTICAGAEAATEAARQFAINFEGISPSNTKMIKEHIAKAAAFYILMKTDGWTANEPYAHSLLEMVDMNRSNHELDWMRQEYVQMGCDPEAEAPDGIAACAVAWAWPAGSGATHDVGTSAYYDIHDTGARCCGNAYRKTRCTSLYCVIHDRVEGEDNIYSSCDRGACAAIRAAGADDEFPLGAARHCLEYLNQNSSGQWTNLGVIGPGDADKLKPGDILSCPEHIMVFVGEELPKEKWPGGVGTLSDCKYAVVHSSHSKNITNTRGPRCDNDVRSLLSGSRMYYGFRHEGPMDESSQYYKDAQMEFNMGWFDGSTPTNGAHYTPR